MTYKETISYLYSQLPVYQQVGAVAYKEGLDNSLALDAYLLHPHRQYKTIHVAGTNGKGSTSHLLAAILQQAGYKVGLYTSPHLVDFRERIRVDGIKIEEQYVIDFVKLHRQSFEPIQPSFFELTMMMAFCYFAHAQVDIAIVEVGLGGRLDSTNIITPDVSVITNIGLDHVQFLGDTLEKIAFEKAGIIKPSIPTIIGEATGEVRLVFEQAAERVGARLIFAQDENILLSGRKELEGWRYETEMYPHLKGELGGYAQVKNTATVLCTLKILKDIGYAISDEAVYSGFANVTTLTGLMGRWQIVQQNPKIICDTAHNAHGLKYIVEQLANQQYDTLHIVLGMVNDKDVSSVLALLPPTAHYYFTKASIARALGENELKSKAAALSLDGEAYDTVSTALQAVRQKATADDLIFIGGSNFVVADALIVLGYK